MCAFLPACCTALSRRSPERVTEHAVMCPDHTSCGRRVGLFNVGRFLVVLLVHVSGTPMPSADWRRLPQILPATRPHHAMVWGTRPSYYWARPVPVRYDVRVCQHAFVPASPHFPFLAACERGRVPGGGVPAPYIPPSSLLVGEEGG